MWYKDWFKDSNYQVVYEHRDDQEAEQMMELIERTIGPEPSRRVLDLACGSGRHSISFARRGYADVTGVDLSPTLLKDGVRNAIEAGVKVRFLESDMRQLPHEQFDLIINLFTSFGYFASDSENEEVIAAAASRLAEGGWLVIDFFNSHWVRSHLVSHDERMLGAHKRVEQTRWIENGRVEKRILLRNGEEAQEFIESVRLYEQKDFQEMFVRAGLTLEHTFGSYTGEPFKEKGSQRLILFARR